MEIYVTRQTYQFNCFIDFRPVASARPSVRPWRNIIIFNVAV